MIDYTVEITVMHWLKTFNNCAETHLGGGVLSPFVFLLIAIACRSQLWCNVCDDARAGTKHWCDQTL